MSSSGKILIFRMGSLGDTVVALPCFRLIRQAYPDQQIYLLTNVPVSGKAAPVMNVLAGTGLCDASIAYPANTRDYRQLSALRQAIKPHRFEVVVNLFTDHGRGWIRSWRDCLFFRSCGIKEIIGHPPLVPPKPTWTSPNLMERESVSLMRKLRKLGSLDLSLPTNWDMKLSPEEVSAGVELLAKSNMSSPFIVASIGTKALTKDWGDENWAKVLAMISAAHPELGLLLIGAADELERSEALRCHWRGRSVNVCGKSSPRVSAALLKQAALFVGHDSGPMHLAAATGIPVVAVYSWHNPPGMWFPGHTDWKHLSIFYPPLPASGWRPDLRHRRSSSEGILLIKPEPVAEACLRLVQLGTN